MSTKRVFGSRLHQSGALVLCLIALSGVGCPQPPGGTVPDQVAEVAFAPAGGSFGDAIDVSLSSATAGTTIRYTTDGSDPAVDVGTLYDGTPIHLTSTTTIKAIAYVSGMTDSAVTQATYTKTAPVAQVAQPTLAPDGGTFAGSLDVQIACSTAGATIRYTTDGSVPSQSNGTIIASGGSVTLSSTTTLAAIAYASGMTDSPVKQATYTQVDQASQVAQPRFTPDGGSFASSVGVQIACSTPGATIRYTTDGSTPSQTNGTVIASGGTVTLSDTTTLAAIAYAGGKIDSPVKQATYTKLAQVAQPTFAPDGGSFAISVAVQISCSTAGATIRYTTDGSAPTQSNGAVIASGGSVNVVTTTTIKAIAYASGMADSTVKQATYTKLDQVAEPTFTPDGGIFVLVGDVQIACATAGATLRYTTDGSAPSQSNGTIIASGGSVHLTTTATIRAIAYKSGMTDSTVKQATTQVVEFVLVPAGTFQMGDVSGVGEFSERPVHGVTISRSFRLGKYEVTQAQWQAVMGANPSYFTGDLNRPVEQVSWDDCQAFASAFSTLTGRILRLPTEAEWEYACRAGTTTDYSYGNDLAQLGNFAWYFDNANFATHTVGQKLPNPWVLYDMHANVWEWCSDWYGSYDSSPVTDPTGPASGTKRVLRGGSWFNFGVNARCSYRVGLEPVSYVDPFTLEQVPSKNPNIGFRLVLETP
jgi:formylglycine-generating enzyme required for sulfatase activity